MKFTSCKHRFQHISGIHSAVRLSCSDDRMQLIDKQNNLSVTVFHFFKNCFQSFLKLAPILCSCNERSHIKRKDRLIFQTFRNVATDDPLGKSFYNRCFSDSRLSDKHRIIFRLTGKNTDHISDLLITADHRIKFLIPRPFYQILSVLVQRIIRCFRMIACHSLIASDSRQRMQKSFPADPEFPINLFHLFTCIF